MNIYICIQKFTFMNIYICICIYMYTKGCQGHGHGYVFPAPSLRKRNCTTLGTIGMDRIRTEPEEIISSALR